MSWAVINQILGLATADPDFWQEFQRNPLIAVQKQGFELTIEEKEVFCNAGTTDLTLFSQYLLTQLVSPEARIERNRDGQ